MILNIGGGFVADGVGLMTGETELPDTGELCPYYADLDRPGQIYVYQSCWDEETGTTYMAYVRYEAETTD